MSVSQLRGVLPHETLWQIATSAVPARALQVIAELGIADLVDQSPVTAQALASHLDLDPDALERLLQLLVAQGVFDATPTGFAHSDASRLLRSEHPTSVRPFVRMMGLPTLWSSFAALDHSVRSGAPAIQAVEPSGFFAYLQAHHDEAQIFGDAMIAKAHADIRTLLDAYDFGAFRTITDIGGGRGHLLTAV